jgi:hypothetical protein
MTGAQPSRDRPSLREALSAAVVALTVGAAIAWTTAPVAAARPLPTAPESAAGDPFRAAITSGPAWIVSPRAARPGEVVHVRLKFTPTLDNAGKPITPVAVFAFGNDIRHLVQGRLYPAEGTFGVDLVVPPGTDWGQDPIVWGTAQVGTAILSLDRLAVITGRNPLIPFIASRSAQPPLWNR